MSISDELQKLGNVYNAKVKAVQADRNLSPEGKEKTLLALAKERKTVKDKMVNALRTQAESATAKIERIRLSRIALTKTESEKFDYVRLTYEAQAMKSALAIIGDDAQKAAAMFQDVKASGDVYKIKAWLENAPALAPTNTPNAKNWQTLIETMTNSKGLLQSEDMTKLEAEHARCSDELEDIKSDVGLLAHDQAKDAAPNTFDYSGYTQAVQKNRTEITARVFEGIAPEE